MHSSVHLLLDKMRMLLEGMLITMLKDEIAVRMKYTLSENLVWNSLQPFQSIRRIREHQVKLFVAYGKEIKHIVPHHGHIVKSKPHGFCLDERGILSGHFHTIDSGCAPGCEFERNGASATEKVQHFQILKLIFIVEDIEQAFPGKIRGWPCLVSSWRIDCLPLQTSSYYSHVRCVQPN